MWAEGGCIILKYRLWPGQDIVERVRITWTACNFGGERPWFVCPRCDRRIGVLYDAGYLFLCRHCCRLAYQSGREDAMDRNLSKAQAIRRRLGGSGRIVERFPDKPRGMHWRTYDWLCWKSSDAVLSYCAGFSAWMESTMRGGKWRRVRLELSTILPSKPRWRNRALPFVSPSGRPCR